MNIRNSTRRQQSVKRQRTGYEVRYPGISQPFIVHFDSLADAKAHRDYLVHDRHLPEDDVVVANLATVANKEFGGLCQGCHEVGVNMHSKIKRGEKWR